MDDLEELQARARGMVERGFTDLKFDPVPGRWRSYVGMTELRVAADRVRAVREAVGPDVDVLVEVHRRRRRRCRRGSRGEAGGLDCVAGALPAPPPTPRQSACHHGAIT